MAYELKTFLDIVNAVREELGIQSADTLSINKIKRHINQIYLNEIVPYDQWKWLRGNIGLVKDPAYRAGTASVEEGSRNVTVTIAPAQSLKGYWFTTANYSERYRIAAHQGGSTSIVLESEYTGATQSAASYSIWTDAVVLPSDCRETFEVTHAFSAEPVIGLGLQKFRQRSQVNQKIEGRPAYYTTTDYKNPDPYAAISGLPAVVSRASNSLVRTLTFASNIEAFFDIGDRVRVSGAGNKAYNGEFIISAISGSAITLTGTLNLRETTTADTGYVVELKRNTSTDEKYRELLVYPGIFNKKLTLNIDYIKEVPPLDEDTDEPLIPLEDRQVLVYGALMLAWKSIGRNPEESASNAQMYDRKLSKMQGKLDDSTDMPMLRPGRTYLRTKRHARRRRTSNYFDTDLNTSFGGSGGAGGASSITGEAGKLAQFSSADNTLTASDIVADNVLSTTNTKTVTGKTMDANDNIFTNFTHGNQVDNPSSGVHGVSGNVVGTTDAQPLTNKTINADNNTISNLAHGAEVDDPSSGVHGVIGNVVGDSDTQTLTGKTISGADNTLSNISRSSVSAGTANHVVINDGSGNLSSEASLAITRGGTGETTANAAFNALSPMTTNGDLITRAAGIAARVGIGSNGQVLTVSSGAPSWQTPAATPTVNTVTDANYTILDDDGFGTILVSTGASNRTITLPTASANTNRVIRIKKTDSGTGQAILEGEGAETIDGAATYPLYFQNNFVEVVCNGTAWFVVAYDAIVQSGTGSNGTYIKYADGTMKQYHRLTASNSADTTWTFPEAFNSTSFIEISGINRGGQGNAIFPTFGAPTVTSVVFNALVSTTGSRAAAATSLMAIGRWRA